MRKAEGREIKNSHGSENNERSTLNQDIFNDKK